MGAADVPMETPKPRTKRPPRRYPSFCAAVWTAAPIMMRTEPVIMPMRRPKRSHMGPVNNDPIMFPMV